MARLIAFSLITTEVGQEHRVARKIKELGDPIKEVFVTYGQFDLIVRIEPRDMKELDRIITRIREVNGVKSTVTLIAAPP